MTVESIPALVEVFRGMRDWRKSQGQRYELGTVLTVAFLAILSGENSLRGIASWVQEQRWPLFRTLELKHQRLPGYETIRTVLRDLDINELEGRLQAWMSQVASAYQGEQWLGLALDGKTLRGSQTGEGAAVLYWLPLSSMRSWRRLTGPTPPEYRYGGAHPK